MATRVLFRRGDATQHDSNKGDGSGFTGAEGEITVDTTNDTIRVHDGSQVGGHRLAKFSEIGTTITTADESSDATSFPVFTTAATGTLQPKTDASAYTYNASNGTLTATTFVGALTGNATTATTATNVVVTDNESTSENNAIVFVADADLDGSTSTGLESDGDLTYNPSTGTVTATSFSGSLTGTASLATEVTVSANNSTDETIFPVFVDGATGSQGLETDTGLTYNPSTGLLTATAFAGALTGNVTGNVSGTAATVTQAAQTAITSVGDLTALNVDGTVTANGVQLAVDESIVLGSSIADGDYLQITHGETSATIKEVGDGQLLIQGAHIQLQTPTGNSYADFNNNGSVDLYWRGTSAGKRFETTQAGVEVTGTVTADSFILEDGSGNKTTLAENASGDITLTLPSSAGTLALTSEIPTVPSSGISNGNVATFTSGVVDNDFLRVDGTSIEGLSDTELKSALSLAKADVGLANVENKSSATIRSEIVSGDIPTLNQDTTGNAATATIAKGAVVTYDASNDGAIGHATVAGFVGKTVVYTNTGDGNDLTLGLPDVGVDISIGEQIHLVNASSGSGSSALIILDLSESGTGQTVNICTGATVLSNTGSADPHIVAGGVATLVATADNTYVLFGSGVVDN